ncbi:hypothetical protein [Umezawaea sp.]|uniref:hypothetical protein n=1 Tax=Umezawaea sp. TaxID=1955258 RepID=UPI002ED2E266
MRATAVVAAAVALLLAVISNALWEPRELPAAAGTTPQPAPTAPASQEQKEQKAKDPQAVKAELLRSCGNPELDPANFTLGALIDDGQGHKIVVASSPEVIAMCGVHPLGSGSGVGPLTERGLRNVGRVLVGGGGVDADTGFLGYGRTLPQVARIEMFLPGGRPVLADTAAETFAYFVPLPRDRVSGLTVRVFDGAGVVLYSGPL